MLTRDEQRNVDRYCDTNLLAIKMFRNSNKFIANICREYETHVLTAAPLPISVPIAFAIGVAAVVMHNPEVTRRFWELRK